jgi:glycerol-3-phosphate dehydrogenase
MTKVAAKHEYDLVVIGSGAAGLGESMGFYRLSARPQGWHAALWWSR